MAVHRVWLFMLPSQISFWVRYGAPQETALMKTLVQHLYRSKRPCRRRRLSLVSRGAPVRRLRCTEGQYTARLTDAAGGHLQQGTNKELPLLETQLYML